jgi:hypothetical protein
MGQIGAGLEQRSSFVVWRARQQLVYADGELWSSVGTTVQAEKNPGRSAPVSWRGTAACMRAARQVGVREAESGPG